MSTGTDDRPAPQDRPRLKRSRSGNPGVSRTRPAPDVDPTTVPDRPATRTALSGTRLILTVALIAALVAAYTVSVMFLPWSVDSFALIAMLTVPALITMVFVPAARTKGLHLWPIAWALGFTSLFPVTVLILTQTWVVSQFWLVRYQPEWPRFLPRLPRPRIPRRREKDLTAAEPAT